MRWLAIFVVLLGFLSGSPASIQLELVTHKCEDFQPVFNKDVIYLARLIASEAGGESFLGQLAVANVVVNIMERDRVSMYKAIQKPGRFDGLNTRLFQTHPTKSCLLAAYEVLNGHRVLPNDIYYYANPAIATDSSWMKYLKGHEYQIIQNHVFYKPPFQTYRQWKAAKTKA